MTTLSNETTSKFAQAGKLKVHYNEAGHPIRAEVIDWKTDSYDAEEQEMKKHFYAPQLASYKLAASKLLGIDADQISTTLVFVKTRDIVIMGENTT